MLDIDYLLERPAFPGVLVYRYRSGALLPRLKAALREVAIQDGRGAGPCERDQFLGTLRGGTFFSDFSWCDWTALAPSTSLSRKIDAILDRLIASTDRRVALFVPTGASITRHPRWPEVETSAGLVLEEPWVRPDTLLPALRLFQATTDLAADANWLDQPEFVASFGKARGRGKRTLLELRHEFDDRVASCTDPITHVFLPDVFRDLHEQPAQARATSPLRRLRAVLERGQGWDRFELIRTLDERHGQGGWTVRDILIELHRITQEVVAEPRLMGKWAGSTYHRAQGSDRGGRGIRNIALWTALVLAWEEHLLPIMAADEDGYRRRPDGLVTALDQFGRDFLGRVHQPSGSDPLTDAWAALDAALIRMVAYPAGPLATSRTGMVRALAGRFRRTATKEIPWLDRLHDRVRRAIRQVDAAQAERIRSQARAERDEQDDREEAERDRREREQIRQAVGSSAGEGEPTIEVTKAPTGVGPWVDQTVAAVLRGGRAAIKLRERVRKQQHDNPIILHGPKDVGKGTLARIYAQAVLCESPTAHGEACENCAECRSFRTTRPFGYIELNTANQGDLKTARKLVRQLKTGSLARRHVVIIANADGYANKVFDVLLKTLEEPTTPVTFVLLAQDLRAVRLAVQSRCVHLRMPPLTPASTRQHLSGFLVAASVPCDERALDVLVAHAGGMPERIRTIVETVSCLPTASVPAVRTAFGYDWPEVAAAYWRAVLADAEPVPEALALPSADSPTEGRTRIQTILLRLYSQNEDSSLGADGGLEPALLHRDNLIEDLTELLHRRADARGISVAALWGELARHWLSIDHGDAEGLRVGGQAARRIVVGAA